MINENIKREVGIEKDSTFEAKLDYLNQHGFLLIRNALSTSLVSIWQEILYSLYQEERYEIDNSVGNVAFEKLLEIEPKKSKELIGHNSVAPYLKSILGKQCQLRSLRAHMNRRSYLQEWHMDFYDYWYQEERAESKQPVIGLCMNTTFYLTDNPPQKGRLRFLSDFFSKSIPPDVRPHTHYTDDRKNPFQVWCDDQLYVDLHPMAGDAVIFYSHIPHQGAKIGSDDPNQPRANIVLHYQQNPMFLGIRFVSNPQFTLDQLGYAGTFSF